VPENKIATATTSVLTTVAYKRDSGGSYVVLPAAEVTEILITIIALNSAKTKILDNVSLSPIATYWTSGGVVTIPQSITENVLAAAEVGAGTHKVILRVTYTGGVGVIEGEYVVQDPGA
jgi:hypothetical protein